MTPRSARPGVGPGSDRGPTPKRRIWPFVIVVVVSIVALGAWWVAKTPMFSRFGVGPGSDPGATSGKLRGYNVLLVTVDTLRADRVGAYGSALGLTPTLDRLAGDGWRFATAYAHVPLTLPSHATL